MRQLLPFFFQTTLLENTAKPRFVSFAEVLFNALQNSNVALVAFCEFIRDRLLFNGQVLSLETFLNNIFDNDLRRINIECFNNNFSPGIILFLNGEFNPEPIILFSNGEVIDSPITLFTNDELFNPGSLFGIDFNLNVPADVPDSDDIIRAFANIYVIAPQNFDIVRF